MKNKTMPQTLSKFEQSLNGHAGKTQKKTACKWNKFKLSKKKSKVEFMPVATISSSEPPQHDEDWEKEIEEFSRSMENERKAKDQTPYDPEDDLNVAIDEITLFDVPRAPSLSQDDYKPSTHHVPPVKWIHIICASVAGQFADVEE